jgi:hypothetical protein
MTAAVGRVARLLGGSASPIGWSVQFLDASADDVLDAIREARADQKVTISKPLPYADALQALLSFESPWTRELIMSCGAWTPYLNNSTTGGDPTAMGPALSRRLDVRCVVAEHTPRYGPGHEATQLWVLGPGGQPPLMYKRTLSAVATDGRWGWRADGSPFEFEDQDRYAARRIRDRLDRPLLLRYLTALGIPVDDDDAFAPGVIVQQVVNWPRRTMTLEEQRRDLGLSLGS